MQRMTNRKGLSDKQKVFAQEYLVDFNGTQAAIRAGYSKKSAKQQASRLLTNVNIQEEIRSQMEKRSERTGVTIDAVVQRLNERAETHIEDLLEWGTEELSDATGKVIGKRAVVEWKPSKSLTREQMRGITSVKLTNGQFGPSLEIRIGGQVQSDDMLMKHLGGYAEGQGGDDLPVDEAYL